MTTQTISSGQTVTSTTVTSGNTQIVLSGGISIDPTVRVGGTLVVSSGGAISGATVSGQQQQTAGWIDIEGGSGYGTQIVSGGIMTMDGGLTVSTTVAGAAFVNGGFQQSEQVVNNGGVASATIVGSQGYLEAGPGGTLMSAVISRGGEAVVFSGGRASGTIVRNAGVISAYGGGIVRGTRLFTNGSMTLNSGGRSVNTIIRGGTELVWYGIDRAAKVHSGGKLTLTHGGMAIGTVIYDGGVEEVSYGCTAQNITISSGGVLVNDVSTNVSGVVVSSGGFFYDAIGHADGVTVLSGGAELLGTVGSGVTVRNSLIFGPYSQNIGVSGRSISAHIASGGYQYVSGGTAVWTTIGGDPLASGIQIVQAGSVRGTVISADGVQEVDVQATVATTKVMSGGLQYVTGVASNTIVAGGGLQRIVEYGVAQDTTIRGGGQEVVGGSGIADGVVVDHGGTLVLSGGSASNVELHNGATIDFGHFGFGKSEQISFVENASGTGGILTISNGHLKRQIALLGQYTAGGFHSAADGQGGTDITYTTPHSAAVELAGGHS